MIGWRRGPVGRTINEGRRRSYHRRRDCALYAADEDRGARPAAIQRAAVDFETPHTHAASRTEPPGTTIVAGTFRGLPSRVPCALARASPASTRSRIRSFSNSARAARMWSCRRPAGVWVSIPSPRLAKPTPTAVSSSISVTRCRRLRPSRSARPRARRTFAASHQSPTGQAPDGDPSRR